MKQILHIAQSLWQIHAKEISLVKDKLLLALQSDQVGFFIRPRVVVQEFVEADDLMAKLEKLLRQMRPDKSGNPGDQRFQIPSLVELGCNIARLP
jgi:hypothetical protein